MQVIAVNLPVDEISGMREMFLEIDKDRSGTITVEEFALVGGMVSGEREGRRCRRLRHQSVLEYLEDPEAQCSKVST
jgi:Ca2+-binding EF-hand superfamily protein